MRIEVSTTQVNETTPELKVSVGSFFEHDIPVVSETQSSEQCLKLMTERHGYDEVYKLVVGQYTVAIQAPARRELVDLWDGLPPNERLALITMPEGEGKVATATLPPTQQSALQSFMDEFKLGETRRRGRVVRVAEDPIDSISRRIASGELTGDELEQLRARAAEILGLVPKRR